MVIQRAAPPIPAEEAAAIRSQLSRDFGSQVWEGTERRVLLIRVPRAEPDPVNDVELAVEHLDAADVEDISHCLLMGDERVAQVYVRPLQDLIHERNAFDHRQVDHWRRELPGQLSHTLFQSPEDPRRRWRLAVRFPYPSVQEIEEEDFDDLVDGIGPQLDTPRLKQLAAVYLITGNDHVRLQPGPFIEEMRDKWQDEERVRRKEMELQRVQDEERRAKEADERRKRAEREALLQEMDRKMARRLRDPAPSRTTHARTEPSGTRGDDALLAESETTLRARGAPRGPWTVTDVEEPETAKTSADALLERAAAEAADPTPSLFKDAPRKESTYDTDRAVEELTDSVRRKEASISHRVEALRSRVDEALGEAPVRPRRSRREARGPTERDDRPGRDTRSSSKERDDRPGRGTPKDRLRAHLEAGGFDVLEAPPTPGHTIDLAAERPEGEPQRVVCRIVPRLDVPTARQLLKTARELEVDLVLCVAEQVDDEAQRLLVATKTKVVKPHAVDTFRF